VEKSLQLQELLRAAGFGAGAGVSTAGIRLVSSVARREGLRDWPFTKTLQDYDALIAAVAKELGATGLRATISNHTHTMNTEQENVLWKHLGQVRKAQLKLSDYRRAICSQINDRLRALQKYERETLARQIDGQLELDLSAIRPSPELERIIRDPTADIG